ncbi:hypothetical protein ACROAG_06605 [Shewanella oncorhynchi]|uniref:hypothetical protein n=1 Tax=Shewanella oncorhynchi TaxID=2726434 RepID=UPI003D79283C
MAENILFVFEGEKTEPHIKTSMERYYLGAERTVLVSVFCSNIYALFHTLNNDEDLELFYLLKNSEKNRETLADIELSDVSQIYLFFDYDGHSSDARDDKLLEMLEFFDEETDKGKLYISYPMVEALRHLGDVAAYRDLTSPISIGRAYKGISATEGCNTYNSFIHLSEEKWQLLNRANLMKANYLINDDYVLPTSLLSSIDIFNKQNEMRADNDHIAVLSGFPLFLLDYYGVGQILMLTNTAT